LARRAKPRIRGGQRYRENLRDFRNRELVELGHREHFALRLVELFQQSKEELDLVVLLDEVERRPRQRLRVGLDGERRS